MISRRPILLTSLLALAVLGPAVTAAQAKKTVKYTAAYSGAYDRTIDQGEGFQTIESASWNLRTKKPAFTIEKLSNGDYFVDGDLDASSMTGDAQRTRTYVDPAEGNSSFTDDDPGFIEAKLRTDPDGKSRQLAATGLDYLTYGDETGSDDPVRFHMQIGTGKPKKRYRLEIRGSQQTTNGSITTTASIAATWTLTRVD